MKRMKATRPVAEQRIVMTGKVPALRGPALTQRAVRFSDRRRPARVNDRAALRLD